jgi:Transposase, Mutator family
MERLPKSLHASVRRVLRQAWELDDADKAKKLIRNLARRLEPEWSGVSGSILEGIDEILTVTRLGLPKELRRSLACTNIVENMMATVRRVCRNVKRLSPLRPPTIPKGDLAMRFALLRTALAAFVPLLLLVQWAKLESLVEDARIASNKGGDN